MAPSFKAMDARRIAQWRMHNLGLWGRADPRSATDTVAGLLAMQAQEFPYAKWSIGQRLRSTEDADIDVVFNKGQILRTHVLRPTWHFIRPADIRWVLRLTAPRVRAMSVSYDRKLELDDRVYARTNKLIAKALEGGKQLTRKELVATLNRSKITGTGQRFGHILLRAELDEVICSGALRGKHQTYALLDERVSKGRSLSGDEALGELARAYFMTRGPSTLKDFSWWASVKMGDCRRAIEIVGNELESREVGDRTYWFARGTGPPRSRSNVIDLIQVYDEYVVSYTLSRDAMATTVKGVSLDPMLFFWHPILLDGQGIGHWRRRTQGAHLWLEIYLYRKLKGAEVDSFEKAIDAYRSFVGDPIEVVPVKEI